MEQWPIVKESYASPKREYNSTENSAECELGVVLISRKSEVKHTINWLNKF